MFEPVRDKIDANSRQKTYWESDSNTVLPLAVECLIIEKAKI